MHEYIGFHVFMTIHYKNICIFENPHTKKLDFTQLIGCSRISCQSGKQFTRKITNETIWLLKG